jgi:hypothetical protein
LHFSYQSYKNGDNSGFEPDELTPIFAKHVPKTYSLWMIQILAEKEETMK